MKYWWQWGGAYWIFSFSQAFAQTSTFQSGEYLTQSGWGLLEIKPVQQGKQKFDINALGSNGSVCNLDGEIYQGKATLIDEYDKSRCDIGFKAKGSDIDVVMNTPETCRGYCGWNAGFEAVYLKPAPGCDNASRTRTRDKFKKLYDRKDYAAAERTLAPLLTDCKKTLDWLEDGWIRNDLALTQAKLGNGAACKATLESLAEAAAKTDRAVCSDEGTYLPPIECESYLPIVRATRGNLKWCAKANNGQVK